MDEQDFPLYNILLNSVKDKKNRNIEIIKDSQSLFFSISNQNKDIAEIIYLLILHYYIKKENILPKQLVGTKITFFNQKTMNNGGRGVYFSNFKETLLLEIIHEFLELTSK